MVRLEPTSSSATASPSPPFFLSIFSRPLLSRPLPSVPPAVAHDESRRIFQKLWTDADEITILHTNYQHDIGPFYDQIKGRLQLDFNKNQLVEKLRRLKKYCNMVSRIASGKESVFKSPHDKAADATFIRSNPECQSYRADGEELPIAFVQGAASTCHWRAMRTGRGWRRGSGTESSPVERCGRLRGSAGG